MASRRIEGQPLLPGYSFTDPTVTDFRKCQTFDYINGYRVPKKTYLGIGCFPIPEHELSVKDIFDTYNYDPALTYGKPKPKAPPPVIPSFVTLDKKVLKFFAYYKETVFNSQEEHYRIRPVEIWYHLEDDSIAVQEPVVQNSGLMQGKFLYRHRIPKNDIGESWHWKDLNIQCDVIFYGRVLRIVDADCWTKAFYESEGVILNEPEDLPKDPYIDKRSMILQKQFTCSGDVMCNDRKKFLEYDKKALRFMCIWDDRESEFGSIRKLELVYYLADDCVEVIDVPTPNSGRDPCKLLLRKTRLPKSWKDLPLQFPSISFETTPYEVVEYYGPKDFQIGKTIIVFGRRFLIYDLDECTKKFYRTYFGYTDFTPICVLPKTQSKLDIKPPPWNGWGSPEDSLQSWLHVVPRRHRADITKALTFDLQVLKFGAIMDSTRPEDQGRQFTIMYRLSDDKISVYERPVQNSGWVGGKFLDFQRLQKPGSSNDDPDYYAPHDMYIGAMVDFYGHRFCLKCADAFVLEFMERNPHSYPECIKENLRTYFDCEKRTNQKSIVEKPCDPGDPVCEEPIGEGFFEDLGLGSMHIHQNPCQENPNPCKAPYDWDMCRKLGYNCGIQRAEHGPSDLDQVCEKPCPGNPDMFEQGECAVCRPDRYVAPEPIMPNARLEDKLLERVRPEDYYKLKEGRFDCYNSPTLDQQMDIHQKRVRFNCPCPPCGDGTLESRINDSIQSK